MSIPFSYTGTDKCPVIDVMYLNKMMIEAEDLLERATTSVSVDKMKYWFGEKSFPNPPRNSKAYAEVIANTDAIKQYLAQTVEFISMNVNSGAYANQDEAVCWIYLGRWFGMKIYGYGERMVTFFHEISHKAIKTRDIDYKGEPAYKGKAVELAKSDSAKALQNAENWGYYIVSYARETGLMNGRVEEWKHTQKQIDIESKRQPTGSDDRLVADATLHLPGKVWTSTRGKREKSVVDEDVACVDIGGHNVYEFEMEFDRLEKKILNLDPGLAKKTFGF